MQTGRRARTGSCIPDSGDGDLQRSVLRVLFLSVVIPALVVPWVLAGDIAGTPVPVRDTSGADQNAQLSGSGRPGVFIPVVLDDGTGAFSYSSEGSDQVLLTGGDVAIILRSGISPDRYDDRVLLRFTGQDPLSIPHGETQYQARANFFIGNNASEWRTGVPVYRSVQYRELYPGISLSYSGQGGVLKSEFLVSPGADPGCISFFYEGSRAVRIDQDGALSITTERGVQLVDAPPNAYQVIGGRIVDIPVSYRLQDGSRMGYALGMYDETYPLIIDPELVSSGYLGGDVEDAGTDIAVDEHGTIYVVGYTHSTDFPVTRNALNGTAPGYHDIFVTAFANGGTEVLYSTFIGGAANDYARSVAVGVDGTLYISGSTECPDFPVKSAFQPEIGGKYDAFILAIRPGGADLAFSSYLGGKDIDDAFGMAVGGDENRIYLTGTTQSQDFPVVLPFQKTNAGQYDAFLTIINGSGKGIAVSTFLGGRQDDYSRAIALDDEGNIYLGGYTYSSKSSDFPVKNPLSGPHPMTYDAFVSKFTPDAGELIYSTYLGGTMGDRVSALALDQKNRLYLTGYTFADDFPVSDHAFQRVYGGNLLSDVFVIGLSPDGQSLVASTYLGGSGDDLGYGITVGDDGTILVTGGTLSADFPVSDPWQENLNGTMNAFVAGLDPACTGLVFSSYLGGEGSDLGRSIVLDHKGLLYITGTTGSKTFPVRSPVQVEYGGDDDAFLTIISPDSLPRPGQRGTSPEPSSPLRTPLSPLSAVIPFAVIIILKYRGKLGEH